MWAALGLICILVLQAAQPPLPAAEQNAGAQTAASIDAQSAAKQAARDADYTHAMAGGADLYSNRKFNEAARSFQQAVALKPDSDQAQFWAGQSLVYARQPNAAISYLESANREGGGDSVGVHLALVAAYAGAGPARLADLDRERALLHRWHDEGTHGNIVNQSGFLLETFYTRQWHVNVVEYFAPHEGQDIVWRFAVRDPAELIEAVYTLERPEKTAADKPPAAGGAWDLVARTHNGNVINAPKTVHSFATQPSYFDVKTEVMKRLRFRLPEHSSQ
jgi:tetratricopeptide (TPR) repeat protein